MKSNLVTATATPAMLLSDAQPSQAGVLARLVKSLTSWGRPALDPNRVEHLSETIAAQPALRQWLLVIASETPRVRRALLARAAQAMRSDVGNVEASEVLEQLADARLMRAVTEYLLQKTGLQPLTPTKPTGSGARVRLNELADRLQARPQRRLAA